MSQVALKIVEAEQATAGARATGPARDRPLPPRRANYLIVAIGVLLLLGGITAISQLVPHGLRVAEGDIRIATVQQGMFHNDVVVRSTAAPLHTTMLDAHETGRVEEVLVNDAAYVANDALPYRLSNPKMRLN